MTTNFSPFVFANTSNDLYVADVFKEGEQALLEAGLIDVPLGEYIFIKYNGCILQIEESARMTKSLGKTIIPRRLDKSFVIRLQKGLFDPKYHDDLLSVLTHEMLHILYPFENHGGFFKRGADKINRIHPEINITSFYRQEEHLYQAPESTEPKRYAIQCPVCGHTWEYARWGKRVAHPEHYLCTKCHHELIRIR